MQYYRYSSFILRTLDLVVSRHSEVRSSDRTRLAWHFKILISDQLIINKLETNLANCKVAWRSTADESLIDKAEEQKKFWPLPRSQRTTQPGEQLSHTESFAIVPITQKVNSEYHSKSTISPKWRTQTSKYPTSR